MPCCQSATLGGTTTINPAQPATAPHAAPPPRASPPAGRSRAKHDVVRMTLTAKGTSPPTADTAQGQPGRLSRKSKPTSSTASPSAAKPDCSSVHPTRTPPKRADSTTPRCGHGLRRLGIASPSVSAESSRPASAARHAGRTTARSARAQPTFSPIGFLDLTPRTALARANAPLRIRPRRSCRTRIVHGRECRAMPRRMVRPKVGSPAWPPLTMDRADPDRAGLTVSARSPGVLRAELPRPSRGRRVDGKNDSCSPLRRITPATPPPRAAAISLELRCWDHTGTSDGTTSNHAAPPATNSQRYSAAASKLPAVRPAPNAAWY